MNYEKLYFAFIEKYKNQVFEDGVYTEVHHIIPRHAGGDDSKENLIRLDYKQHTFAHHLLWKIYKRVGDYHAWLMMSGQEADNKLANLRALGQANVESGHLDRIRPLANNEKQRSHASRMAKARIESGELEKSRLKAVEVWTGSNHTEEYKQMKRVQMKEWAEVGENYHKLLEMNKIRGEKATEKSEQFSKDLILNAERNEEFLQKSSSKSKNKFVSPEGLEFDSPIFAAKYYGNVEYYIIENWCKRNKYGWSRKPKAV
nr:MAG TPA: HNH endonuclease [Caudoviricetes sp.]